MEGEERLEQVKEYLRIIERTRLLRNNTNESGEIVGQSLTFGNGLARKGGNSLFMKEAILNQLAYFARKVGQALPPHCREAQRPNHEAFTGWYRRSGTLHHTWL